MVFLPRRSKTKKAKKAKAVANSLTPLQKQEVKKLTTVQSELKYVGGSLTNFNLPVWQMAETPITTGNRNQFISLITPTIQGAGVNTRLGNKIYPVKCRSTFVFYMKEPQSVGVYSDPPQDYFLNICIVKSKSVQNPALIANIPPGKFLLDGAGGTQDPLDITTGPPQNYQKMLQVIDHLPINRNEYTVLRQKRVRMGKNNGSVNGDCSTTTFAISDRDVPSKADNKNIHIEHYEWSPGMLKYSTNSDTLPNNENVLILFWATSVSGRANCVDPQSGTPLLPLLRYGYRNDMLFRDD
jgi:hypothetical protein